MSFPAAIQRMDQVRIHVRPDRLEEEVDAVSMVHDHIWEIDIDI